MLNKLKKLVKSKRYEPLNKISIFKDSLKHNYKYLRFVNPNIEVAPVLKSNAYGHGIRQVGGVVDSYGAPFICVDSIFEAYELKKANIRTPILIMGYVEPENLRFKKLPFAYAVFSLDYAQKILKYQPHAKLHLFIDTGMNREGMKINELVTIGWAEMANNIEGIMSHLASADEDLNPQSDEQLKVFKEAIRICKINGIDFKYKHISATHGILNRKNIEEVINVSRAGVGLYGFGEDGLKPTLKLTTKIAQVKDIKIGDRVGYSGTFVADKDMKIAVLPIGYANGVDRRLSNKGVALLKLRDKIYTCPILGRISMNITTIDVTEVFKNEDETLPIRLKPQDYELVLISENPNDPNSIKNIAKICETIEYDILVGLDSTIRRKIV